MSLGQNDNAILKLLADEQLRKENAALAAENANLKALQWETLKERNKAEAENERLRKAGDAMAHWIDYQHDKDGYPFSEAWEAANKVKKGKSV